MDLNTPPVRDYFEALKQLTASGALEITLLLTPPCSNSTATEIALAQGPGCFQINEPFANAFEKKPVATGERRAPRLPQGFSHIHRYYEEIRTLQAVQSKNEVIQGETIKLVVSELNIRLVNKEDFLLVLSLCKHIILGVRDPHMQIPSLAEHLYNSKHTSMSDGYFPGTSSLNREEVMKIMQEATETSEQWSTCAQINEHACKMWRNLLHQMDWVKAAIQGGKQGTFQIVDMTDLIAAPDVVLKAVCDTIGYSYDRKTMVDEWTRHTGYSMRCAATGLMLDCHWNQAAKNSTSLRSPSAGPRFLGDAFTGRLNGTLQVSLTVYDRLLHEDACIRLRLEERTADLGEGKSLIDYNPFGSYACLTPPKTDEESAQLDALGEKYSELLKPFHPLGGVMQGF